MKKFILIFLLAPSIAFSQYLCPTARVNDQDSTYGEWLPAKPAVGVTFYDSVYSTCYKRITDADTHSPYYKYSVPKYSQLQAFNADQSKLMVGGDSANGAGILILKTPNWSKYRFFRSASLNSGTFASTALWSPTDPNIIYYWNDESLKTVNIVTRQVSLVRAFTEYDHLGTAVVEDISRDLKIVLQGYPTVSEVDSLSDLFMYDIARDVKGRVRRGWTKSGPDGYHMSPKGDYLLVHWGVQGCSSPNDTACFFQAYDSTWAWQGQCGTGGDEMDVTLGSDSTQWAVMPVGGALSGAGSITGPYIAAYKIPNGYNLLKDNNDSTAAHPLIYWPFSSNGLHISGRAPGAGFIIASSDKDTTGSWTAFEGEIVKIYLDSRPQTPHLERLAQSHSYPGWLHWEAPCPPSYYFAQPHATLSPDGTRIVWGSNWGKTCETPDPVGGDPDGRDHIETYIMDISNKARNEALINQTENTWVKREFRTYYANGTGGGAGDTLAPMNPFSHTVFAPELGSLLYFGGGGHGAGARRGNDVWAYNTANLNWYQLTVPDSMHNYPQAVGGVNNDSIISGTDSSYSLRSLMRLKGGIYGSNQDTIYWRSPSGYLDKWRPFGSVRSHNRPWTGHSYDQQCWDRDKRVMNMFGPNFFFGMAPDSLWPAADSLYNINCRWTSGVAQLKSDHLFGSIPKMNDGHTPRSAAGLRITSAGLPFPNLTSVTDIPNDSTCTLSLAPTTTQSTPTAVSFAYANPESYYHFGARSSWAFDPWRKTWAFIDSLPNLYDQNGSMDYDPVHTLTIAANYDCWHTAGYGGLCLSLTQRLDSLGVWTNRAAPPYTIYARDMNWSKYLNKMLSFPANPSASDTGRVMAYDPQANTWTTLVPSADPTYGKPPGGNGIPLAAINNKDHTMLVWGCTKDTNGLVSNGQSIYPTWLYDIANNIWKKMNPVGGEPPQGTQDLYAPVVYDPTNNVFIMVHTNPGISGRDVGYGQPAIINSNTSNIWTYKPSAGSGVLFAPITPAGGAGGGGGNCGVHGSGL